MHFDPGCGIHWRRCKYYSRLCRLANGDLSDDEDVEDTEDAEVFVDTTAEPTEDEREVSLPRSPGVSLSGRQTTRLLR